MEEEELTGEAGPSQGLKGHLEASQEGDPCKTKEIREEYSEGQGWGAIDTNTAPPKLTPPLDIPTNTISAQTTEGTDK